MFVKGASQACITSQSLKMSGTGLVILALIRVSTLEAFEFPKNFNQIDPLIFDFVKLDVLNFGHEFDSDIGFEMIENLFQSSNFFISNDLSTNCDGRVLKVTFEQTADDYENRTNRYLKDPCMSVLIINGTYQDTFASQPYHFALLDDELFEVQKYSQSQKLIAVIKDEGIEYFEQDIFERRVNFKGAKIITADGTMRLHEYDTITRKVLYLMEKKFNFSAEMYRQEPLDFGTKLANGTWTGFVAAMMDGKMDFCASVMAFSTYRLEVVSPGFGFEMNDRYFVFRKPKSSGTDAFAIFYVFSGELWLAIGFSSIIIAVIISRGKLSAMMKSFGSVIKALLGQSERWTSGRPSKK